MLDIRRVIFRSSSAGIQVDYLSSYIKSCVQVRIVIYLRKWPKPSLDLFHLQSNVLDVWFEPSLSWEIGNLVLHTSYGNSLMQGSRFGDPLVVHNVSVSSINGTISGWYVPDTNLNVHNEYGDTKIFLMSSSNAIAFEPQSVSISSSSGNIHVHAALEKWPPKVYAHRTEIYSRNGNIITHTTHGSYTRISSVAGNISSHILPYSSNKPASSSEIFTTSEYGNVEVYVGNTYEGSTARYDPLLNTSSQHTVGEGSLVLRYPYRWWGEVEARIEQGELKFDASSVEELQRSQGYVKARRGHNGTSRMKVYVGTGALDVLIGLEEQSAKKDRVLSFL